MTVVAIDIPTGCPTSGRRQADQEARTFVQDRRSSVFACYPAHVLDAKTHAEAVQRCKILELPGISQQSWALRDKIQEAYKAICRGREIYEVHPEVCFRAMAHTGLPSKKTWSGVMHRIALLRAQGIELPAELATGSAAVDDVLDAAAAAWSAHRIASGTARRFPATDQLDEHGRLVAIWY